jgi:hypothetical protein
MAEADFEDLRGLLGSTPEGLLEMRPASSSSFISRRNHRTDGIGRSPSKVYPELVVNDSDGKPETVAYHLLPAMLLNEMQKQGHQLAQKDAQIAALQRQLNASKQEVEAVKQKVAQIDALAGRLDALEQQARASKPERLAATMR